MPLLFSLIKCASCGVENFFDMVEEDSLPEEIRAATPRPVQCRACGATGIDFERVVPIVSRQGSEARQ